MQTDRNTDTCINNICEVFDAVDKTEEPAIQMLIGINVTCRAFEMLAGTDKALMLRDSMIKIIYSAMESCIDRRKNK